jgi:hypothetical protein
MAFRKTAFVACLVLSIFCLVAGYFLSGQWIGVVLAIVTGLAWLLAGKYPASWLPHLCLLASVCLAVVGRLAGASPLLMLLGSGFALAVWDLSLLNGALGRSSFEAQTRRYENKHLQLLALALGFGLLVTFFGRWLHLQLPFVVLMLFVALVIFGLDRVWGYIKKAN